MYNGEQLVKMRRLPAEGSPNMNKILGFLAGITVGAVVGGAASLLFTPKSSEKLRIEASSRWQDALADARTEMERTQEQLQAQYEQIKS